LPKLSTEDRKDLSPEDFACPIDRKLPINDAAHVRDAMARFDQVETKFCHPDVAKKRILEAAKKYGIDTKKFEKVNDFRSTRKEG